VGVSEELGGIADTAVTLADPDERLVGVLAAELCAFDGEAGRSWLALDADGRPVDSRARVREAVSIAALCELAGDAAGGGELDELRSQLLTLRLTEAPPGIDEAEEAALALQHAIGAAPRVASPVFLDEVGAATRRLELALGGDGRSPFAEAMKQGVAAVEALTAEVEAGYKRRLR
jgi:hypothetical protein